MTDATARLIALVSGSLVRHGLTALTTVLIMRHMLTAETASSVVESLVAYTIASTPGAMALVWSWIQKRRLAHATVIPNVKP